MENDQTATETLNAEPESKTSILDGDGQNVDGNPTPVDVPKTDVKEPERPDTSWYESLPDELKNDGTVKLYSDKGVEELARAASNYRKKISEGKISPPGSEATEEQKREYYKSIGCPDSPDDYRLGDIELDGQPIGDGDRLKRIAEHAHKVGLPADSVREFVRAEAVAEQQAIKQAEEKYNEYLEKSKDNLSSEFGSSFETKVLAANKVLSGYFGSEFVAMIRKELPEAVSILSFPPFIKGLVAISKATGQHAIVGETSPAKSVYSKEEAEREIKERQADKEYMAIWNDKTHPKYEKVKRELDELYDIATEGK